jgi:hypothetical protein
MCVPIFIAALFTIPKLWKQPRSPTTNKYHCYLYAMEFSSATIKNEILSFASKWVELENIILSEVSQAQMAKIACSPSYAVILLDMCYTLRGECAPEE